MRSTVRRDALRGDHPIPRAARRTHLMHKAVARPETGLMERLPYTMLTGCEEYKESKTRCQVIIIRNSSINHIWMPCSLIFLKLRWTNRISLSICPISSVSTRQRTHPYAPSREQILRRFALRSDEAEFDSLALTTDLGLFNWGLQGCRAAQASALSDAGAPFR